jgi:hypothetical protein
MKNIIVDFNLIGSKVIHGLNIQRKILHFVSLAIYFQVSRLESQDQTHLLLNDSIVGKKLMMGVVCFFDSYEKRFKFSSQICYQVLENFEKLVMPY